MEKEKNEMKGGDREEEDGEEEEGEEAEEVCARWG